MKYTGTIVFLGLVIGLGFLTFNRDVWMATYYPDPGNLSVSNSQMGLHSLAECRAWVKVRAAGDTDYDYECGRNCKLVDIDMYQCQETTR